MTRIAHSSAALSNPGGEQPITRKGTDVHPIFEAMRAVRDSFIKKPLHNLADACRVDLRACKYWFARRTDRRPSADAFVNCLRSDVGGVALDAFMRSLDRVPVWYAHQQRLLKIAELERRRETTKQELKNLKATLGR